jgi:hypothetical protein
MLLKVAVGTKKKNEVSSLGICLEGLETTGWGFTKYFRNKHISGYKAENWVHQSKKPVHRNQTLLVKHKVLY